MRPITHSPRPSTRPPGQTSDTEHPASIRRGSNPGKSGPSLHGALILALLVAVPTGAAAQCDVTVTVGQNIQTDGVDAAAAGNTVCVDPGTFSGDVTIDKALTLRGSGRGAGGTLLDGQLLIDGVTGTSGAPAVVQSLRVSNPAGSSVRITTAEWLTLDDVAVVGGGDDGIAVVTQATSFSIIDSLIEGNAEFGLRGSTTADFDTFVVQNTVFRDNVRGGILFHGGSAVNDGSVQNLQILDSTFVSNSFADVTPWGGGVWLKTAGPGSFIDGVLVQGSEFRNNGSSNSLNQVGITIRVRPGTTITDVTICENVFANDVDPGTQETGINIFDETAEAGYEPILICDNTFDGLIGVDGTEQDGNTGTLPTVEHFGNTAVNGGQESRLVDLQFVGSVLEIPTLGAVGLAALSLLLGLVALGYLHRFGS